MKSPQRTVNKIQELARWWISAEIISECIRGFMIVPRLRLYGLLGTLSIKQGWGIGHTYCDLRDMIL